MTAPAPQCPYCAKPARLTTGAAIYPHLPRLSHLQFWRCSPCDAYVGCHRAGVGQGDGTTPLGRLANAELRAAKQAAHAAFDPLWKDGGPMRRHEAYAWLAKALDIRPDKCHIGEMDINGCRAVVAAATNRTAA